MNHPSISLEPSSSAVDTVGKDEPLVQRYERELDALLAHAERHQSIHLLVDAVT